MRSMPGSPGLWWRNWRASIVADSVGPGIDLGRRGRLCAGAGQLPVRFRHRAVCDSGRPDAAFGVAKSTLSAKAKQVRDLTKMSWGTAEFLREDMIEASPMIWYIQVDGLIVDARELPLPVQAQAFELGVIPYIPHLAGTAPPLG